MSSVGGVCPGCKRALADHLPSSRMMPAEVPAGKVAVVNGRCVVDGEPAPQKCCWVQLREPMTLEAYRERHAARTIKLEPCPGCGGRLTRWGSFLRKVVEGASVLGEIRLLRGLCTDDGCPVCTVTHYPVFLTPYEVVPTVEREEAIRSYAIGGSWLAIANRWPVSTVQRWVRGILERAMDVTVGMLGVWQRVDDQAPVGIPTERSKRGQLMALFGVCDAVGEWLRAREGWEIAVPALAVPRMFRPMAPTTLPVWT